MALETMLLSFLLSSIVLVVLVLHLDQLTYRACPADVGVLDGCNPDTQLILSDGGLQQVGNTVSMSHSQDIPMEVMAGDKRIASVTTMATTQM